MDTELTAARLAHGSMLAAIRLSAPSAETVNQVMIGRELVGRHALAAVDLAMELAGGAGFYRSAGLERKFRDIQASRYHPLQSGPQVQYTGAMALGLPVNRVVWSHNQCGRSVAGQGPATGRYGLLAQTGSAGAV
jgi:alkylation response protein AidB-like acyl-CoA dehydrogenase